MSLLKTFSDQEHEKLQEFIYRVIKKEKLINELQKLLFDQHFFARYIKGHNFDIEIATQQFKNYLVWRKKSNIETILDFEFNQFDKIKELCPNGFHSTDKQGRPIFILQVGQIKLLELMDVLHNSTDMLVHFIVKELEHTWRVKFPDCKEFIFKGGVDQIKVIIDLKGAKLKDITNQQMLKFYKQIVLEVQRFFPEFLNKLYIVNTPLFFENVWESQLIQSIVNQTTTLKNKILITSNNTHDELLEQVDEYELPQLYGGNCKCGATCIYSEKGPWTEIENQIDYKNPQLASDDDNSEGDYGRGGQINFDGANFFNNNNEEFKMHEEDEDQTDLLGEKKKSGNIDEFYQQEELNDLKNQIRFNMPNMNNIPGMPGGGQTNNNTMVTEQDSIEPTGNSKQKQQIGQAGGVFNNNLINLPGLSDQKKKKFSK